MGGQNGTKETMGIKRKMGGTKRTMGGSKRNERNNGDERKMGE